MQRLIRKLDGHALAGALSAHFAPAVAPAPAEPGAEGVTIDGKAQRGRLRYQSGGCPARALNAFGHKHGVVLAHEPIEHGAEQERGGTDGGARAHRPGRLARAGADRRRTLLPAPPVRASPGRGGDNLLLVKANQPTLYRDLELLFDPPPDGPPPLPLLDRRGARTVERGHGRVADTRHLIASTDLTGYLDWPGLAQVFRLERTWQEEGRQKRQLHYGLTSLSPVWGPLARLLALKRGHWRIEMV